MTTFEDLPNRNNTSFAKELYEVLKGITLAKDDMLKYHQKLVVEYVMKIPNLRGILAYHKVGSGKTILAVAIVDALIQLYPSYQILFISNKSLHPNFRDTIRKYNELLPVDQRHANIEEWIDQKYRFITLNASNMLQQVKTATHGSLAELVELTRIDDDDAKMVLLQDDPISLENCVVVHDEWHNFLNSIANGSKNAIGLYDAEMRAKEIKIIALTGTPVVNDPYELAIGFNTLAGYLTPPVGKTKKGENTLFGEDYNDFVRMFIDGSLDPESNNRPRMKNRDKFCDRILGLVSYYGADTEGLEDEFPLEYDIIINRVPMSHKQYAAYINARDRELEENKRGMFRGPASRLKKSSTKTSSSYRVRSRQISNFFYPPYATEVTRMPTGYTSTQIFLDRLKPSSLTFSPSSTPPEGVADDGLDVWSPKFVKILKNISIHMPPGVLDKYRPKKAEIRHIIESRTKMNEPKLHKKGLKRWQIGVGPGLVYSQFLDEGIEVFGKTLEANGFVRVKNIDDLVSMKKKEPRYAVISGEIDLDVRNQLVKIVKDESNINCEVIALLLITASGSEGLDLAGRHVHLMEPYWHWARPRQVIARIVRFRSLAYLPLEEQTVQPYIYLSDYPKHLEDETALQDLQTRMKSEATTDVTLYHKSIENQMLIDEFLTALQESSIDCLIHYGSLSENGKKISCRICSPTGKILWQADNLLKDIDKPSICQPYQTEVLKTQSIKIPTATGIQEYRYIKGISQAARFFEYRPELKAYVEIYGSHPAYQSLVELVNAD